MARFATESGLQLYYNEKGEGEAVVLVHGWGGSGANFIFLKKDLLKAGYRVLTFDHRGHGNSDRPAVPPTIEDLAQDLHELIESRNLGDFTLLGYSMGVYVIFEYLKKYPDARVKKLILVDMSPKVAREEQSGPRGAGAGRRVAPSLISLLREDFPRGWLRFYETVTGEAVTPEIEEIAMEALGDYDKETLVALFDDMLGKDYRGKLGFLKIPVHHIYARPGSLYGEEDARAMQREIPHAKLHALEGATHLLVVSHPAQFNRTVLHILQE